MNRFDNVTNQIFKRVFLAVILIVMFPILALMHLTHNNIKETRNNAEKTLAAATELIQSDINGWLQLHLHMAHTASDLPYVRQLDIPVMKQVVSTIASSSSSIYVARVDNADGQALVRSDDKPLKNYSERIYFQQAIQGNIGQQVLIGKTHKKPLLCFAVPIFGDTSIVGVLSQCAFLNALSDAMTTLNVGSTGYASLVDSSGKLIVSGQKEYISDGKLHDVSSHTTVMSSTFDQPFEVTEVGIKYITHKTRIGLDWQLIVQQEHNEVFNHVNVSKTYYIIIILITLVLCVLLAWYMSIKISKPVKTSHEELKRLSLYDALTAVPNQYLLKDRLTNLITKATRNDDTFVFLVIDFRYFKQINDTWGHQCGDQVLKIISTRIKNLLRDDDTIARVGGDEFVVLVSDAKVHEATEIAKRVLSTCDCPVTFEDQEIEVNINIGVSVFPRDGVDGDSLFKHADCAVYTAKTKNKQYQIYSPLMVSSR